MSVRVGKGVQARMRFLAHGNRMMITVTEATRMIEDAGGRQWAKVTIGCA
jgi:hypothetical protein